MHKLHLLSTRFWLGVESLARKAREQAQARAEAHRRKMAREHGAPDWIKNHKKDTYPS